MIAEVVNSFGLTLDFLRRLVADLDAGQMVTQAAGAVNHPAWTVGHLTHSCEAIGGELGLPPWLPADWPARFGTGSVPRPDPSAYPSKAELLAILVDAQERVVGRLHGLGDVGMARPLPDERYRATFPTVGHAVAHILTAHAAVHVGELIVWRRVLGLAPVREAFV